MPDRFQVGVEFVNQWNAVRDIDAHDVVVGNVVQVFDQGADRVAVRGDDDAFARLDGRGQLFRPQRHHPRHGVFQAFGQRNV